jgi:hypothetical protein
MKRNHRWTAPLSAAVLVGVAALACGDGRAGSPEGGTDATVLAAASQAKVTVYKAPT